MANNYKKWTPEQRAKWNEFNSEYARKHYVTLTAKANLETDKDLVEYFYDENRKPKVNVNKEIKRMLRAQIELEAKK